MAHGDARPGGHVDTDSGDARAGRREDPVTEQRTAIDQTEYRSVIDPDVDLHDPAQQRETRPRQWDLMLAASAGGILGALSRYGIDLAAPHTPTTFPWSTVIINASGCLLIGVLMVSLLELTSPHRWVRPFLGVGVLGGYTTFSTFTVDTEQLITAHRPGVALTYVVVTVVVCLTAVWFATTVTANAGRAVIDARVRRRDRSRSTR